MGDPALKLEQIPQQEAKEVENDVEEVESGEYEFAPVSEEIDSAASAAEQSVDAATAVVAPEVAEESDLAAQLEESRSNATAAVLAAQKRASADASQIFGVSKQEGGEVAPTAGLEKQPIPPVAVAEQAPAVDLESVPKPETNLEAAELTNQIDKKQKALDDLYGIPEAKRTSKDEANIGILSREIALLNNRVLTYERTRTIKQAEARLTQLDEEMVELLKGSPANDVESLPPEQKAKAEKIIEQREILETSVETSKVKIAELTAAALGIDRLLTQSRAQLQSVEAAEMETAKKEKLAAESAELERIAKEGEAVVAKEAEKPSGAAKAFKKGVGKGMAAAGVGIGVPLFGFSKVMGWIDKGLKHIFSKDIVEKLKWALSVPEKILDWTLKKMGVEETDDKKH